MEERPITGTCKKGHRRTKENTKLKSYLSKRTGEKKTHFICITCKSKSQIEWEKKHPEYIATKRETSRKYYYNVTLPRKQQKDRINDDENA